MRRKKTEVLGSRYKKRRKEYGEYHTNRKEVIK